MEQIWQLILIPAMGYLFIQNNQLSKMMAVLSKEVSGLSITVSQMDSKFDVFVKSELDALKEIAKNNKV